MCIVMLAIDIETTGTDPNKNSIVSVAAINTNNVNSFFTMKIKPFDGAEIHADALDVNGFTVHELNNSRVSQDYKEGLHAFHEWVVPTKETIMLGHNVHFDWLFLKTAFEKLGLDNPFSHRLVDIHSIAQFYFRSQGEEVLDKLSLDTILEKLGLEPEPKPHCAFNGASCALAAYNKMVWNFASAA